jgi:putative two-component system response regulator
VAQLVTEFPTYKGGALAIQHLSERWDGSGSPDGLTGEAIPLASRLVAVADAFDRLASDRDGPCRADVECALASLRAGSGRDWDPRVVEEMVSIAREELADADAVRASDGRGRLRAPGAAG